MSHSPIHLGLIGDIHARFDRLAPVLDYLSELPRLDAVLLVGDVSKDPPWSERGRHDATQVQSFAQVLAAIEARLSAPVLFVPGNHDPRSVPLPGNVDRTLHTLENLRIFGIGGAGPARFGFPYEWDEPEIAALKVPTCDLLLVHCPPFGTLIDALSGGRGHVGSHAIRTLAEGHHGVLVCGHIHESAGFVLLGDCLCINVGALGEPYGRACVGELTVQQDATSITWTATLTELAGGASRTLEHVTQRSP